MRQNTFAASRRGSAEAAPAAAPTNRASSANPQSDPRRRLIRPTPSLRAQPTPLAVMWNSALLQLRPLITQADHARAEAMLNAARNRAEWLPTFHRRARWMLIEDKMAAPTGVGLAVVEANAGRDAPRAWLWIAPNARQNGLGRRTLIMLMRVAPGIQASAPLSASTRRWLQSNAAQSDRYGRWHWQRTVAAESAPITWSQWNEQHAPALQIPGGYAEQHQLTPVFEPARLHYAGRDYVGRSLWLQHGAMQAWARMRRAAELSNIQLEAISGFRSIAYQAGIFQRKLARGLQLADILKVNTAPGYSEHHSGRALDLGTPDCAPAEEAFEATPAFIWLLANAAQFGFRMSYPRTNPHGVVYEPWHWYWLG